MKRIIKFNYLSVCALLCIAYAEIYSQQDGNASNAIEQAIANNHEYQGLLQTNNLKQESDDAFEYAKNIKEIDNNNLIEFEQDNPLKVTFLAKDNLFNSGTTLSIISYYKDTQRNKIWIQTERWVSKKSSYLTWTNAALAATAVGTGIAAIHAFTRPNPTNSNGLENVPMEGIAAQDSTIPTTPGADQSAEQVDGLTNNNKDSQYTSTVGNFFGQGSGIVAGGAAGAILGKKIAGPKGAVVGGIFGSGFGSVGGAQAAATLEGKEVQGSTTRKFLEGAGVTAGLIKGHEVAGTAVKKMIGAKPTQILKAEIAAVTKEAEAEINKLRISQINEINKKEMELLLSPQPPQLHKMTDYSTLKSALSNDIRALENLIKNNTDPTKTKRYSTELNLLKNDLKLTIDTAESEAFKDTLYKVKDRFSKSGVDPIVWNNELIRRDIDKLRFDYDVGIPLAEINSRASSASAAINSRTRSRVDQMRNSLREELEQKYTDVVKGVSATGGVAGAGVGYVTASKTGEAIENPKSFLNNISGEIF